MVLPSIQIGAANALVYRSTASSSGNWTMFTENYNNSRYVPNSQVTSSNVANLRVAWQSDKTGQVTGQPMVSNGIVYFGDWGGVVYAVNLTNGEVLWHDDMSAITGHNYKAQISSTLAIVNGLVYGGMSPYGTNPEVFALNQTNGNLVWEDNLTQLSGTNMPSIWASPIYYQGLIYIGVAAFNQSLSFEKGQIVALNSTNGALVWKFQTMIGVSGGAPVWSTVVVDPKLNSIYFGTGDAYTTKLPNGYAYSILSLNALTGGLNWNYSVKDHGDLDFGSTPNLFTMRKGGVTYQAVGLGSKDGHYYVLNQVNGQLLTSKVIVQGSDSGGIIGLAGFIYKSQNNPEIFIGGRNRGTCTNDCGQLKAYLPNGNKIAWVYNDTYPIIGSVTVIPGAVLFPDNGGYITAISSSNGTKLYSAHFSEARSGITVVNNMVIFGTATGVYALEA